MSMLNINPAQSLYIERNLSPISLQEYKEYKWKQRSTSEKISFFAKNIFSLGHHSKEYSAQIEARYATRMAQLSERGRNSSITINDKIRHQLPSTQVEVINKLFKFTMAGVIYVKKGGYVCVKLSEKPFHNMFNHINQHIPLQKYAGDYLGPHITLAWPHEGKQNIEFFKKLHGKIVVFDKATYSTHRNLHKIDLESNQLTAIRKIAGLSPALLERKHNKFPIPFHVTIGEKTEAT